MIQSELFVGTQFVCNRSQMYEKNVVYTVIRIDEQDNVYITWPGEPGLYPYSLPKTAYELYTVINESDFSLEFSV